MTVRNIKTREGYDFWDKLCAIPRYGFIHSADNSRILKAEGIGNWIEMHSAQEVVDAAQDEINGLRAERDQLRVERDGANERAGLLLKAKNEWADRARAAEEEAGQIRAAISRPETVFIGMKRGTIAKTSLRSMIDLYGEVPNGEEQQLLEIAQLRAEVEALRKDKDRLDAIEGNCWDVRYSSCQNGDSGDSSIGLEIVGHFMDAPCERVVGENYNENLRAAIDQAMTADAYPPARPDYGEEDAIGAAMEARQ